MEPGYISVITSITTDQPISVLKILDDILKKHRIHFLPYNGILLM